LAGLDIHECVGVEVDSDAVSTLAAQGFDARLGRAESLAFPDASFDVVVLDYVAHHIEHLQRGLIEAARVARKAVIVLDPWYDLSIASQRVAHDFDLWSKCIDRRLGMIHDPSVSAAQLARPFNGLGDWRLDCRYRLILQLVSLETIETQARHQLDAIGSCRQAEDALEVLLDRAREHGFSDDGMILFSANRISSQTLNI
jgi:SAM-dependent methyltransferase